MAKFYHQSFMSDYDNGPPLDIKTAQWTSKELESVRFLGEPRDLFDFHAPCQRKINLSHMDEYIDREKDWAQFLALLVEVDLLVLVDDRIIANPLMANYDKTSKLRLARALTAAGCQFLFVKSKDNLRNNESRMG